jgi:hypothetical protein
MKKISTNHSALKMSNVLNLRNIEVPVYFHSPFAQHYYGRLKGVGGIDHHRRVVLNYPSDLASVIADMRENDLKKSELENRGQDLEVRNQIAFLESVQRLREINALVSEREALDATAAFHAHRKTTLKLEYKLSKSVVDGKLKSFKVISHRPIRGTLASKANMSFRATS